MAYIPDEKKVHPIIVWIYLILMISVTVVLCYFIVRLYKEVDNVKVFNEERVQSLVKEFKKIDSTNKAHSVTVYSVPTAKMDSLFTKPQDSTLAQKKANDRRLLILIALCGALGSMIYILASFTNFFGESKLQKSWLPWYVAKPFIGAGLAIVIYFVLRAGFLTANVSTSDINLYGILALSCFMGLFSDEATLKLKDVFEAFFNPKDNRTGKLDNSDGKNNGATASEQGTVIVSFAPKEVKADTETEITILGHNFPDGYDVKQNGEVVPKDNFKQKDENAIVFTLPKMEAGSKVKITIYDPKENKDIDAGVIVVK